MREANALDAELAQQSALQTGKWLMMENQNAKTLIQKKKVATSKQKKLAQ